MRWRGRRASSNVEDRRGQSRGSFGRPAVALGGGGGLIVIGILLLLMCMGVDIRPLLDVAQQVPNAGPVANAPRQDGQQDELSQFVSVVLADTEEVWEEQFRAIGATYRRPTLVIYRDQVASACGFNSAATGPFYCPADQKVYIDLSFYEELKQRLGAPGDFAQAYVIAHEVGHHVQNLLGTNRRITELQQGASEAEANELSVRLELQADFLAGVWAHHAQQKWDILEAGDIEEGIGAANAIGDDRLQKMSRGYVVPEKFTHGTSKQRVRWFLRGLKSGDLSQGDTFAIPYSEL